MACALLYADIRYEGGTHGNTGDNEPIAYMGILSVLLQWHVEDPVDDVERDRNDVVFSFQNNRNPFIDNPEWVACLFMDECDAACPQDLDGDGLVGAADLAMLLGSWGPCEGCPTDFDFDGDVDAFDLAQLLGDWGPCD